MKASAQKNDWVMLEGQLRPVDVSALAARASIEKLSITKAPLLTANVAQSLTFLPHVSWLWLWCDVARPAMKYVIAVSGLKTLDILSLKGPGRMPSFASAKSLKTFRCNHYLTAPDLLAIAEGESLVEIGVQGSAISPSILDRLLDLPRLESLDLEGTRFDDDMARQLSRSKRLLSVDLGATRLSRKGLSYICRMAQLRALDLWATRIDQQDLDLLRALPKLEYLSIGSTDGHVDFIADRLLRQLTGIKSLKRVWLDGIALNDHQRAALERRYDDVRY
jgi:hypothetical protein